MKLYLYTERRSFWHGGLVCSCSFAWVIIEKQEKDKIQLCFFRRASATASMKKHLLNVSCFSYKPHWVFPAAIGTSQRSPLELVPPYCVTGKAGREGDGFSFPTGTQVLTGAAARQDNSSALSRVSLLLSTSLSNPMTLPLPTESRRFAYKSRACVGQRCTDLSSCPMALHP